MTEFGSHSFEILIGKLSSWADTLVSLLPNFLVAIVVLLISYGIARIIRSVVRRTLIAILNSDPLARAIAAAVFYATLAVGMLVALEMLQLQKAVTSLLAGAGVVGLAVSFAFQDLATNFVSGLFITVQRPLVIGDLVKTNDYIGRVARIGLRSLTIVDLDGQHVVIPSKDIFQSPLVNFSTKRERRINLGVGVSYASDLELVARVVKEAVSALSVTDPDRGVRVHYQEFGDSSINFVCRFWILDSDEAAFQDAQGEAVIAIKKAFDAHDITIPFPIRTLDFGIKGGERLAEVIAEQAAA